MDYFVISSAAFLASLLTLFSGFGLGSLLMPVVAIFFDVEVAIGITAVVHFLNNLFKFALFGRRARIVIVLRFGLPAILAAVAGALLLERLAGAPELAAYSIGERRFAVTTLNLVIGGLIVGFVALELWPRFRDAAFGVRWMPFGGLISGFFGGLSGHQGSFRAAFLIKAGLDKEAYIATGVVIACLVDVTRLGVYASHVSQIESIDWKLIGTATTSAFLGAFIGARLMRKVTLRAVRIVVSTLLVAVGLALAAGIAAQS